jgi:hypothetical protein
MRSLMLFGAVAGIGALAAAIEVGCGGGADNCTDTRTCTTEDASVDSNKDVVTDGPPQIDAPPGCDLKADPKDSPACVDGSVGVFVDSAGKDSNDGSKANPVATLKAAFLLASQKGLPRVYVCEGNYSESPTLMTALSIYGGFKCGTWSYSGTKPTIGTGLLGFKIDGVTGVSLVDLYVKSASGVAAGDSSIAMLINQSDGVTLLRMKLESGKGKDGADGTVMAYSYPTQNQLNGHDAMGMSGGTDNVVSCPNGQSSTGAKGGDNGFGGSNGMPALGGGKGGVAGPCNGAGGGGDGTAAASAANAASPTALGALSAMGWKPSASAKGTDGSPGQGGGGGYGSGGGGGGGGGAGGCGGAGGGGGSGGGSSLGLVSLTSGVTLTNSEVHTADAGKGGTGSAGQMGQPIFGAGGNKTGFGCNGGNGAAGGNGGSGAGGAGGLSIAVLWRDKAPTIDNPTQSASSAGAKGVKGAGGTPGTNDGIDGLSQTAPLECKSPLCN